MKTIIHLTMGAKSLAVFLTVTLFLGMSLVRAQTPFTVNILSPTGGESFNAQANIFLNAIATDSNKVDFVQFFSNGTYIGGTTNPFSITWSNVPAGNYTLTALATDSAGNNATSSPVNITVGNVTNPQAATTPFVVGFVYPTNGQSYTAPASVGLDAWVTDSNLIKSVAYYSNGSFLGSVTNNGSVLFTNSAQPNPFSFVWSNVAAGSYSLTAVATDAEGNKVTSVNINITVGNVTNPPPPLSFSVGILYPTNGETFSTPVNIAIASSAIDTNAAVESVQYFANTNLIGTANASQGSSFQVTWSNVPVGSYTLTAVATDAEGNKATSATVNITVGNVTNPPPPLSLSVDILSPTNGETFSTPVNISVESSVVDTNAAVESVQYFAGTNLIGTAQNSPFLVTWSNVPAGNYTLTAVATDAEGNKTTSAAVNITVGNVTNPPPPLSFSVNILYPTNAETFSTPVNIAIASSAIDTNAAVQSVQYFANTNLIGTAQNSPFLVIWSNVPPGSYTLTAVATDAEGNKATSAYVNITVGNITNPPPPLSFNVDILSPTNGEAFQAPADIYLHAGFTDSNTVDVVEFFSNGEIIGAVSNQNTFAMTWSNVPAGSYLLTALATDSAGNNATSGPVNISVVTQLAPTVNIFATDPVAVQGTNCPYVFTPQSVATNYVTGTNTATFLVHRNGEASGALTVYYSIGGTASNGVDYAAIPNFVTIPNGQTYGLVAIVPLGNTNASSCDKTVILTLTSSPPTYIVGLPSSAGVVILGDSLLPITNSMIQNMPDCSLHMSLPATNGMNFCLEVSTNLVNWVPVCTNTVLKGSAQYVDPNGASSPSLYYRIVPVSAPATY